MKSTGLPSKCLPVASLLVLVGVTLGQDYPGAVWNPADANHRQLFGSSNFIVNAERAIQVNFPTKESFQYLVFSSTDLTNWLPIGETITACNSNETVALPATNDSMFYRAQELPPDLSKRIPGLTSVFLDTARLSSRSNEMTIAGMRVQSTDYTYADYLTATYALDFCKQSFLLQQLEVITNVGATCGLNPIFFLKDATNQLVLLGPGGNTYFENTPYTRTSTGQVFTVALSGGQMFEFTFSGISSEFRLVATGPGGDRLSDSIVPVGGTYHTGPFNAYKPGTYSFRIEPYASTTVTLTFRFRNLNRRATTTLVSGDFLSASLENYWGDFAKFRIRVTDGQTLRLRDTPGAGQAVSIFNSLGILVGGASAGGPGQAIVVPISATDDYTIIYVQRDFTAHTYSTQVTLIDP
jgi:hypothetical protein